MTRRAWLVAAALLGAMLFALQGGEYTTWSWLELRKQERRELDKVAALRREVDSLVKYAKLVETDIETQERIARERHGMLRSGEHVFILEEPKDRQP
ncbi:MAG: hypothetical protein FJ206_07790 [Gemmatimonadetes bacterium]|nr:hypothetical protein [Gemmatimonadota bacterium]